MKKLFLLLLLISFSCKAQKVEPIKPEFPQGDMTVLSIVGETATLTSKVTSHGFIVDAPKDLVREWDYFFILETNSDSKGLKTRPATIRFYAITPEQAARNISKGITIFKQVN